MRLPLRTSGAVCIGIAVALTVCIAATARGEGTGVAPSRATATIERLPLGVPAAENKRASETHSTLLQKKEGQWVRTGASFACVLGLLGALYVGLRYVARRGVLPGAIAGGRAPSGILEVLGRYPAGGGVTLLVLKFDRRILLCAQSAGRGVLRSGATLHLVCELSQPEDVASILLKMRGDDEAALAKKFQGLLADEDERAALALDEPAPARADARKRGAQAVASAPASAARAPSMLRQKLAAMRESELAGRPLAARRERA